MSIISKNTRILMTWVLLVIFSPPSYSYIVYDDVESWKHHQGTQAERGGYSYVLNFGPPFPVAPKRFEGMVVLANPEDGCQAIAPPPNATGINPTGKWIAAIKKGNCSNIVKTRNAQNANYHMALIYEWETNSLFIDANRPDEVELVTEVNESSNKSIIRKLKFRSSDFKNITEVTLLYEKKDLNDLNINGTVPHGIKIKSLPPGTPDDFEIKIHAILALSFDEEKVKPWTYEKNIIVGITNDDFNQIICNIFTKPPYCYEERTRKNVPFPDKWTD